MKEIGILFSAPMIEADLAGIKTETRRTRGLKVINETPDDWDLVDRRSVQTDERTFTFIDKVTKKEVSIKCPYGQKGDIHWVRETFMESPNGDKNFFGQKINNGYEYFASVSDQYKEGWPKCWTPSIHMPKIACRIWHEVLSVHLERLHEITDQGALAEGIKRHVPVPGDGDIIYSYYMGEKNKYTKSPVRSFFSLWEKINGSESLEVDPWLWVIRYKVLSTTGRPDNI